MNSSFRKLIGNKVTYIINPKDLCPCDSGMTAEVCCLLIIPGINKLPAETRPTLPNTGYDHDACYATGFGDCSNMLSREHYISKTVLEKLNINANLCVGGVPWLKKGEVKSIPPASLTSKILCDRHNSSLSSLDAIAGKLYNSLIDAGDNINKIGSLIIFCGYDIERWLLKVLCGFVFSENKNNKSIRDDFVNNNYLNILFGYEEFNAGQGLYVFGCVGEEFPIGTRSIVVQKISELGRIWGVRVFMCGFEFVLALKLLPNQEFLGRSMYYRPSELYFTGSCNEKSILLSWPGAESKGTIQYTRGKSKLFKLTP